MAKNGYICKDETEDLLETRTDSRFKMTDGSMMRLLCLCSLLLAVSCGDRSGRRFPLPVDESRSMLSRWATKEVLESLLLDDMEQEGRWRVREGKPEISYTRDN